MKNKKSVSLFSALLIIFFHLWINIGTSQAENFLKLTAYIGVDMFFFLSAYSLSRRETGGYFKFVLSRFCNVYIKYILFAFVAFFYSGWAIKRLLLVISGVELFVKGGGAFLWFVPAIMIVYIVFPLIKKLDLKNSILTFICSVIFWVILSLVFTNVFGYKEIFIFISRFPIILCGYYFGRYGIFEKITKNKWIQVLFGLALLSAGYVIIYFCAYKNKLQVPFYDTFYITTIPATLGLIMLVSLLPEFKLIKWLGSSTLEMYAIQMIFGYKFANNMFKVTKNVLFTNFLTILFVIITACITHYFIEICVKLVYSIKRKSNKFGDR